MERPEQKPELGLQLVEETKPAIVLNAYLTLVVKLIENLRGR